MKCPECEKKFDTNQGMAVHRYRIHGVRSTNKSAIEQRERTKRKRIAVAEAVQGEIATNGTPPKHNWKKAHQDQEDFLTVVQFVFPKGIATSDRQRLAKVLEWVHQTGVLVSER